MHFSLILALGFLASCISALPGVEEAIHERGPLHCPGGAYVIAARGHDSGVNNAGNKNYGLLKSTLNHVIANISDTVSMSVKYPNGSPDLPTAVGIGVDGMKRRVKRVVDACPNARIILLGYSEGAMVTMNTICGTSSPGYAATPPLDQQYSKNIAAVMVYGDLTQTAGESYDMGTCTVNGTRARTDPAACDPYASRIHSYCDTGDLYCCSGGNSLGVHHSYPGIYNNVAVNFIVNMYDKLLQQQQAAAKSS